MTTKVKDSESGNVQVYSEMTEAMLAFFFGKMVSKPGLKKVELTEVIFRRALLQILPQRHMFCSTGPCKIVTIH